MRDDEKHRMDLIKSRIQYRKEAGLDTSEAEQELAVVQDKEMVDWLKEHPEKRMIIEQWMEEK